MKLKPVAVAMVWVSSLMLMWACGSGGGGDAIPQVALESGQILDSLIEGLDFRSVSAAGLTDARGTFSHGPGETVTFSIGNLVLGRTDGKPIATIVDLVEGATGVNNRQVVNIARLLQSLDSDCDLRNGIQISARIRAEVSPRVINFDQSAADFGSDPVILDLFADLAAAGAFSGGCPAALRPEAEARQHLEKSINDTWRLAGGAADTNADGVPDRFQRIVRDANGRVVENDDGIDGGYFCYREYNDQGQLVRLRWDLNRDGIIDQGYRFVYDASGNKVEEEWDEDADGTNEERMVYAYDAFGRQIDLLQRIFTSGQTYRYRTEYGPYGKTKDEIDDGDDGSIEETTLFTYAAGKLVREVCVGVWTNYTRELEYSGDNLVRRTQDNGNDGSLDWKEEYTYDGRGNVLARREYTANYGSGSLVWELSTEDLYTYNENDQWIEQVLTYYSGGRAYTYRQQLTRNADGNVIRVIYTDPDGRVQDRQFQWEERSIPDAFDIHVPAAGPIALA